MRGKMRLRIGGMKIMFEFDLILSWMVSGNTILVLNQKEDTRQHLWYGVRLRRLFH
jgi:hypothetical protein